MVLDITDKGEEFMTLTIIDGRPEDTFKPAPHYSEIAVACRAMGMNVADDD